MSETDIVHRFVAARSSGRPVLMLLHRTGGSENDLLEFGDRISRGGALLAPRGQVLEDGKPRYFRRLSEGLFDLDDLALRTRELGDFILRAKQRYGIGAPIAVGFSNGANIAWSLLLARPDLLAGAVLMRPMMPFEPKASPLGNLPVLVISGRTDTIVPPESAGALPELLRAAGAQVEHAFVDAGHTLTEEDGILATAWLDRVAAAARPS